jgi:hypothetical protein
MPPAPTPDPRRATGRRRRFQAKLGRVSARPLLTVLGRAAPSAGRALGLGALLALLGVGCVRVKPYQREDLARRAMIDDQAPGERRFEQHAQGSREGAEGGSGEAGGGCGCNGGASSPGADGGRRRARRS